MIDTPLPHTDEEFAFNEYIIRVQSWPGTFKDARVVVSDLESDMSLMEVWNYGDIKDCTIFEWRNPAIRNLIDASLLWMQSSYVITMKLEEFLQKMFEENPRL